jgi:iron complex transport system substrate-binding protein
MTARRWIVLLSVFVALAVAAFWCWLAGFSSRGSSRPAGTAPARIASLTLGTDEILSELVSADRLVCVTQLADDPEMSNVFGHYPASIPRLREADPERIIGLNPDLVCVAPYNSADFLKVMERSGLSTYRNEACDGIDSIERGILKLGKRVGEPGRAQGIVERMRVRRQQLARQLRGVLHRPRVLFWSGGSTAGSGTTIDDIIREAGGINVAKELRLAGFAEISPEQVIAADPEYILLSRWTGDERAGHIENHPLLRKIRAVEQGRVLSIQGRYLTSVSHFVLEGAERLGGKLHPDRMGQTSAPQADPSKPRAP